jgi:hypothetical protein
LNRKIKNDLVGKTVGLKTGGVHKAINRVFADNRLDKAQLTATQDAAESVEERDAFEFQPNLKKSFLPHIIELALDAEARLVFVRVKKRRDLEPGKEPEKLKRYISELSAYLKNQETPLIDFTHDPRLVEAHFGVGDHLNRTSGRRLFTSMLAEALRPLFDISPYGKR